MCNLIAVEDTREKFLDGHPKRLPFWAWTNLSSNLARAERRCDFFFFLNISKNQSERDQLRGMDPSLAGGCVCWVCSPWRKSVSWPGKVGSLKDNEGHAHCEEPFKCPKKLAASPTVAGTRAQQGATWLPFRSWREITVDNVGEVWKLFRRDVTGILKVVNSPRSGIFTCGHDTRTFSVSLKSANTFEPWDDKIPIKA